MNKIRRLATCQNSSLLKLRKWFDVPYFIVWLRENFMSSSPCIPYRSNTCGMHCITNLSGI